MESGESIIGTPDGAVKATDFRRKPENGGRWGNDGIDGFKGGSAGAMPRVRRRIRDQVEGEVADGAERVDQDREGTSGLCAQETSKK